MTLRSKLLASIASGLLGASAWSACGGAEIHLLRSGEAAGEVVRLGDVADVTGDSEAETTKLRDAEICPAPIAGQHKNLSLGEIRAALARQGINVSECKFYGASRIDVAVGPTVGDIAGGEIPVARAKPSAKAVRRSSFDSDTKVSDTRASDNQSNDGRLPDEDARQNAGEEAKPARLVKRGEAVALTVRGAGVKVSTSAVAQADGVEGETIAVRAAADRNKTFFARVVGPQAVEIRVGAAARNNASTSASTRGQR